MDRFRTFLEKAKIVGRVDLPSNDEISASELKKLEKQLDKLFADAGIDIEFTRHFLDRVNDARNIKQITIAELRKMFQSAYKKYKQQLAKFGDKFQAVLNDPKTMINVPFVLQWDRKNNEMDLVSKTVMRKKNFKTYDRKLKV